jgi:hypothetical protein
MKLKIVLIGAAAIAAAALSACGGGDHNSQASTPSTPPTMPTTQQLDTAQVLALAQKSSEVSAPFEVNGGMLTLTDTSDTTDAISVNGM